ncbi:MAG: hypothetical protein LBT33_05795 [Spirochaetia bacterium]|jgi:hypothetical protein|nr:hypothetical protein [Spirochaetia bacterium]
MNDMKKTCMVVAAVLLAAAGLYAEGRGEDPLAKSRNQVTLSGTLQFADGFPVISAEGKTYRLFAPRFMREAYTLKPGLALSVEGYIVQQGPWPRGGDTDPGAAAESVVVQKVTVDGKTYEVPPMGRDGFGGGRGYHPRKGGWDGHRREFCGNYRDGGRREDFNRGYGEPRRDFREPDGRERKGPR